LEKDLFWEETNAKNTQWGPRLTTTKGRELMKAINSINGIIHTTGRPTYWPTDRNKIPDVIDFYISKKVPMHYMKIEDSYDLDSDHSPIIMTLCNKIIKKESNYALTNKFTDWESFQSELNEKIQLNVPLRTTHQLDIETERIVDLIQEVAWNNIPQIKKEDNWK
jgi:hypothetical protein